MEEEISIQSSNINAKWLENIYENIQKLEQYERLMREGCTSLLDYFQIPENRRDIIIGDVQFKNLRFYVTEFNLLLSDLSPILDDQKSIEFRLLLEQIQRACNSRRLFIKDIFSSTRELRKSVPTPVFFSTINILTKLKVDLFREIKDILYINMTRPF